jgi:hypothetical protein
MGTVGVFSLFWMYPVSAVAAMWSGGLVGRDGPHTLEIGLQHEQKMIPPFRAAPRERTQAVVRGHWMPDERVRLDASWSWLRDKLPSGVTPQGPGDVRLGAHAVVWEAPVALGLGWLVKLPNAADEGEIGTDETDATVLGTFAVPLRGVELSGGGGIVIQGDPIRFANQDDAGLVLIGVSGEVGGFHLYSQAGGTLESARNPVRMSTHFGGKIGCPVQLGLDLQVGLSPAAPALGGGLWVGWVAGCD